MINADPDYVLRFQKGTSDKIWGAIIDSSPNQYFTFWGKVGGVIAFKAWEPGWHNQSEIRNLMHNKKRKGYSSINIKELPEDAREKFEQAYVMANLGLLRVK